jgi:hypothetical protein
VNIVAIRNAVVGSSRYIKAGYLTLDPRLRRQICWASLIGSILLWLPTPFHGWLVLAFVLFGLLWIVPCWLIGRLIAKRQ